MLQLQNNQAMAIQETWDSNVNKIPLFKFCSSYPRALEGWLKFSKGKVNADDSIEFALYRGQVWAIHESDNFVERWYWNGLEWKHE